MIRSRTEASFKRAEAEQYGIVPQIPRDSGFARGLGGRPYSACDLDDLFPLGLLCREFQHRLVQADLGITNGELRRVHADSNSACAGSEIVACQSALPALVQLPVSRERQRMRGDHESLLQL